MLLRELAADYNMSVGGIHSVVRGRSWKHVT
jgi:hypothetical protein